MVNLYLHYIGVTKVTKVLNHNKFYFKLTIVNNENEVFVKRKFAAEVTQRKKKRYSSN
jgi:hypothetical protein